VRDWQDYTAPVNKEIRDTVKSDHVDRFVLMNNGITMIARNLRALRRDRFQVEDFQIVNGCQTTHVLFNERNNVDGALHIPLRIIATEDDEVIKSIIRGTNRQTRVEDDQFFALTDFAEQLEDYFQTFTEAHRLYYERRSGQYTRQPIVATRVVTHRNLVRAVASIFLEAPDRTQRRYQSLREEIGKSIFAKGQKLDPYYVAAYAMYRLDVNFRTTRVNSKLKPARFHILLAMRYLANPDPLPLMNSREMVRYCKKILDQLWDNTQSDELCTRAADLAEGLAEGNFDRDNIRTQQFTAKVIAAAKEESAHGLYGQAV
jgi:hypothetical protein